MMQYKKKIVFDKTTEDFIKTQNKIGFNHIKSEAVRMIWEVDDDLDEMISKEEFNTMYKRWISDTTGLEPRKFFKFAQFLMYDKEFRGKVTIEDAL